MNIYTLAAALLGLIALAKAKLNATVVGLPVSIPVLGLIAVIVALVLAAAVLYLLRSLVRDGLNLRPRMVPT